MTKLKNVLLTTAYGLDKRSYAASLRNIEGIGKIVGADCVDKGYVPENFDSVEVVPRGDSTQYIYRMLDIIFKHDIDIIIPASDPEVIAWDNYVESENVGNKLLSEIKLSRGTTTKYCKLCIPFVNNQMLDTVFDKRRTKELQIKEGIVIPTTTSIFSMELLEYYLSSGKPVVIKPAKSYGSRGLMIVNPNCNTTDIIMDKNPSPVVSPKMARSILEDLDTSGFIIQDYWSGRSFNVECLVRNYEMVAVVPHERTGYRWGRLDEGTLVAGQQFIDAANSISSTIGVINGVFNFEANYVSEYTEVLGLVEINPRVSAVHSQCKLLGYDIIANMLSDNPEQFLLEEQMKNAGRKYIITEGELRVK